MRINVVLLLVTMVASSAAFAQKATLFDGVWVRSDMIDNLTSTRSVRAAFQSLAEPSLPLAILINVQADSIRSCTVARSFNDSASKILPYASIPGFGKRYILDDRWVIASDSLNGQYIALYDKANVVEKPFVYARIPTKNRSLSFVLQRIVNIKVLEGRWVDSTGDEYRFFADQHAEWPAGTFQYRLTIQPRGHHRLQITGGKLYSWECDGSVLKLYVPSDKGRKGRTMIRLQRR
ncbi:hypothetical protein BH10BAC6_BH10BAC6_13190 [soil metagenome]